MYIPVSSTIQRQRVEIAMSRGYGEGDATYLAQLQNGMVVAYERPHTEPPKMCRGTIETVNWASATVDPIINVKHHPFGMRWLRWFGRTEELTLKDVIGVLPQ